MSKLKHTIDLDSDSSPLTLVEPTPIASTNGGNVIEKANKKKDQAMKDAGLQPLTNEQSKKNSTLRAERMKAWSDPRSVEVKTPSQLNSLFLSPDPTLFSYFNYQDFRTKVKKDGLAVAAREIVFPALFAAQPNLINVFSPGCAEASELYQFELDGKMTPYLKSNLVSILLASDFPDLKQNQEMVECFLATCVKVQCLFTDIHPIIPYDDFSKLYVKRMENPENGESPAWDVFLDHLDGAHDLFKLFVASIIDPNSARKQALVLTGPGGGGKSQVCNALRQYFGEAATAFNFYKGSTTRLEKLELKRVAFVTDSNSTGAGFFDSGFFKALTGDDFHSIDPKNKTPRDMEMKAKLVICTNKQPKLDDTPESKDRYLGIQVNRPADEVKDANPDWDKDVITQAPAFVAKCWEFYKSELAKNPNLKNQLPINMKLTQAAIDSELSENPFLAKIQRLLFINTTDKTLNTRTNEMYELLGAKGQMEYELCIKALKSLGVEKREKRVDGVKGYYFVGVRFKDW